LLIFGFLNVLRILVHVAHFNGMRVLKLRNIKRHVANARHHDKFRGRHWCVINGIASVRTQIKIKRQTRMKLDITIDDPYRFYCFRSQRVNDQ